MAPLISLKRAAPHILAASLIVGGTALGYAQGGDWYEGKTKGFWGLSPDSQVFEGAISKFGLSTFGGRVEEPAIEKQYSGYRFSDLFSVEGAKTSLSLPASGCRYDSITTDLDNACHGASWTLTGVATLPFHEGLSLYGRLGMQYWENNSRPDSALMRWGQQDVGTMLGLGLSYQFRKDWYLHMDVERYSDLSQGLGLRPSSGVGLDTSIHTIGFSVRF
jgi:hypothetical protein